MLKTAYIYEYFDLIISNEDIKQPKPSPDMYIKAMEVF
jgi:beta-phosphoglucomutase-like phosphatase (HAD superfamily)